MERLDATAYLAPAQHVDRVVAELRDVRAVHDRLVIAGGAPQASHWAQNVWLAPVRLRIESIGHAARELRAIQRNWWPYAIEHHRRLELIREKLPHVGAKALRFPDPAPTAPLGSFTLLDKDTLLASAACSSPFPNGEPQFVEFKEHEGPTSRAYLKLFEAFTLLGKHPRPGEKCLDLGASPGGWTWVLATLGAQVTAYDRSPLDARIAAMPGVSTVQGDAFAATPERVGPVDWLCSDVICFPEKLLEHVQRWLASGLCRNFVCTLKFQQPANYEIARAFAAIPGSRVLHLHANKHELTWMRTG